MTLARRIVAATVAGGILSSCAVILHPERKGNNSTPIDTVPLIVDILLFIPGIVPGVVALVLDFGTGAIYLKKGGSQKPFLGRRRERTQQRVYVRVVDDAGHVLDERAITVHAPQDPTESVVAEIPALAEGEWGDTPVHIEVATDASAPVIVSAVL